MKKNWNKNKNQDIARILIYSENNKYIGVCLDFDIVEEASNKEEAIKQINEATRGYIINICKNKLDDRLLNRPAPEKYWKIYKEYNRFIVAKNEEKVKKISSEIKLSSFFSFPIKDVVDNKKLMSSLG